MKILVADDEKFIRKGIMTILGKSNVKNIQLYEAKNGLEMLAVIENQKIDLVISDIKMPKMTGLDFLKAIHQFSYRPQVILLSGYGEFEYAQEAIKYGVSSYLLKPLKKEELLAEVNKIRQERFKGYTKKLLRSQLKNIFLNEQINHEDMDKLIDEPYKSQKFFISIIRICENINIKNQHVDRVKDKIREQIFENQLSSTAIIDNYNNIVIFSTLLLPSDFFTYLSSEVECHMIMAKGDEAVDIYSLRELYVKVRELSKYVLLIENSVITFDVILSRTSDYKIPHHQIKKLCHSIYLGHVDQAIKNVEIILSNKAFEQYDICFFEEVTKSIDAEVIQNIFQQLPKKHVIKERYHSLNSINNYNKLKDYKKDLLSFIKEVSAVVKGLKHDQNKFEKIDIALKYVMDNYKNQELNMSMVSNYVSLNYSYFSQLFKERTGQKFVDYVITFRVNRAKELLAHTGYMVYEIAERVGYKDTKQFVKMFKLHAGMSPKEYRNQALNKKWEIKNK